MLHSDRFSRQAKLLSLSVNSTPNQNDLDAINLMKNRVLVPRTVENVFIRECEALSTRPMNSGLIVPEASVRQIAALAYDAPIQLNHDTFSSEGLPIGRVFESSVTTNESGDIVNVQRFFVPRTPVTEEIMARVDGGAINEVSVSFGYDRMECTICHGDMFDCEHMPGTEYAGAVCHGLVLDIGEYFETSLVWAGAADGTRIRMAAARFGAVRDLLKAKRTMRDAQRQNEVDWVLDMAHRDKWSEKFFNDSR
jgi:hypothetical protein